MSQKEIDSKLYKTWFHYRDLANTAKTHGQHLRRILLSPIPLNETEEKRKFLMLFNERAKLILVDDENGGFEYFDAFSTTLGALHNRFLSSLEQSEVDSVVIPLLRDRLIDFLLHQKENVSSHSLPSSTQYGERYGIYKIGPRLHIPAIPSKEEGIFPCVTTDFYFKKHVKGWPGLQFAPCPAHLSAAAANLTAKTRIYSERVPVPGEWSPVMETAVIFSTARPQYTIVTPMFNVESYAARNVFATLKATAGLWALDIVLDTCVDATANAVYNALLGYLTSHNFSSAYAGMCHSLCTTQGSSVHAVQDPSPCTSTSTSILTQVRVISSMTTLFETRAENLGLASSDPATAFYASVQADMLVTEAGWNFYLSLPMWIWSDVSSAGTKDALNIPYRKDESDRNFSRRIEFPAYRTRY
jgi:hypothetical protein